MTMLPSLKELSIGFSENVTEALLFGGIHTETRLCPILELIEINDIGNATVERVSAKIQNIIASRASASDGMSPLRAILPGF